ncbi:hypothetical protein KEM48_005576 [Puccinia striiformis f. sp. tritici PST-130]|nr:hypothetical protein KEM48_005576 [Puccinia striiformis f. sp. tritici PST-130]
MVERRWGGTIRPTFQPNQREEEDNFGSDQNTGYVLMEEPIDSTIIVQLSNLKADEKEWSGVSSMDIKTKTRQILTRSNNPYPPYSPPEAWPALGIFESSLEDFLETWVVDTDAGSMACALERNVNISYTSPSSWRQGPSPLTCGILPIGVNHATVTTRGLKWNLDQTKTSMTGLLSTSNHILPATDVVEVESDERLIWTMEIPENVM